jgi:surface-anchored protein
MKYPTPSASTSLRMVGKCVALAFAGAALSTSAMAATYSAAHGDIELTYDQGWEFHLHLGPQAILDGDPVGNPPDGLEFEPDEVIILVPGPSIPRPAGSQWDLTGNNAGDPVWFLPATQDPAKPFLGLATDELDPGDWLLNDISLRLEAMSGPAGGHFSLWNLDSFGQPEFVIASSLGLEVSGAFFPIVGSHAHFNWGFTEPGIYELTFQASGTHRIDGLVSGTETFTFEVVPEPGTFALLGVGAVAVAFGLRRRSGKTK